MAYKSISRHSQSRKIRARGFERTIRQRRGENGLVDKITVRRANFVGTKFDGGGKIGIGKRGRAVSAVPPTAGAINLGSVQKSLIKSKILNQVRTYYERNV